MLPLRQDPSRRLLKRAHEAKEATGQKQGGRTSGAKESTRESQEVSSQGDKEGGAQQQEAQGRSQAQAHGNAWAVAGPDAVTTVDAFWRKLDAQSVARFAIHVLA